MNICTIIARNYVAHARVLAESFKRIHPDGTCTVLVIDDPAGFIDPAEEQFELLTIGEIGLPSPEGMAASYDVMELSTAVKPWLLRHLLDRAEVDSVMYLDPDIRVFASLEEIARRAREHGVVLTPHFLDPLPRDGRKPAEEDILIAGSYNLGFIALGDGETAAALLDWWSERLENHCLNEPEQGRFVDQRWIDLAPGLWPGIDVVREPTYNIAYWNLATRQLADDGGGGYLVDGEQLRFFHFSGFDPRHPSQLSKHQDRVDVAANPALVRICGEYAEELLGHGFEQAHGWPYGWNLLPNGLELDRAARRVFREGVEAGEFHDSVFSEPGATRFKSYLTEIGRGQGANSAVNRYAQALWDSRPDFRQAAPSIEPDGGLAFLDWLHITAPDTGVAVELLPPGRGAGDGTPQPRPARPEPGANVVGYVSSERGVGEAARQMLSALRANDLPVATIDSPTDPAKIAEELEGLSEADYPYDFNLLCVNADMLPYVATALGDDFFAGRHSAGLWFWEVSHFLEEWRGAFKYVDEVWVASEHIANALRPLSITPVHTVRMPVTPPAAAAASRAELGMPDGFCFLFLFDYRSVFRRKNPLGVIEAFCDAFEPGSGPSLIIKSICGEEFPAERQELTDAVRDRPEIHLAEEMVSVGIKNAMIASCDCYVSLHRSEGFGLTMAEAMYFGRPTIATAYSGNLDFMTEDNSFLVPYEMAKIGPGANPYPADKEWAEPDLERASALMRQAFENPEEAAQRGRRAGEDIRRTHSPEAAAALLRTRMERARRESLIARLQPTTPARASAEAAGGRDRLQHFLEVTEAPPRPGAAGKARAVAKRLYLRLLRPYAAHQQRINAAITESLDELREGLSEALRIEAETEKSLSERIAGADRLVEAASAEPYMVDDRLGARTHPVLGETIGYRTSPGEMDSGGYRGFEDLFRGPEAMIRDRQRVYLDLIGDRAPVFDAGCGRGELLDLLAERGIPFQGVDLDPDMVKRCREKGHENVEQGDLLEALERVPPGTLGAIFSAQVIEHVEFGQLQSFLELSRSRLRPGGLLIAETVNPHSAAALKAFWVDPTHQHPLFPETMLALCALAGFVAGDVFAPVGTGDWDQDRTRVGEYAVVAAAPDSGS